MASSNSRFKSAQTASLNIFLSSKLLSLHWVRISRWLIKRMLKTWKTKVKHKRTKTSFRTMMVNKRMKRSNPRKMAMNTKCSSKSSRCL